MKTHAKTNEGLLGPKALACRYRLLNWKFIVSLQISSLREARSNLGLQISARISVDSKLCGEFGTQEERKQMIWLAKPVGPKSLAYRYRLLEWDVLRVSECHLLERLNQIWGYWSLHVLLQTPILVMSLILKRKAKEIKQMNTLAKPVGPKALACRYRLLEQGLFSSLQERLNQYWILLILNLTVILECMRNERIKTKK